MIDVRVAVQAVRFLGDRYFVLELRAAEIAADCEPGQFVMIAAAACRDPLLRRAMAIYELLREGDRIVGFSLLIEIFGRGTRRLAQLQPGDEALVLGPLGRPFPIDGGEEEHLLVMGGVGAAPFPFLADRLLAAGHRVRAFIGARSRDDLLCMKDFESRAIPVHVATEDGTAGERGFVTAPLEEYLDSGAAGGRLYSCGPTPMMQAVEAIAVRRELAHVASLEAPMACGLGVCLSCVVPIRTDDGWRYERVCREGPVFEGRTLIWERM